MSERKGKRGKGGRGRKIDRGANPPLKAQGRQGPSKERTRPTRGMRGRPKRRCEVTRKGERNQNLGGGGGGGVKRSQRGVVGCSEAAPRP